MAREKRKFVFRYEIKGTSDKAETFSILHNGVQVTSRTIGVEITGGSGTAAFIYGDGRKTEEIVIDTGFPLEVPIAVRAVQIRPENEGEVIDFAIIFYG